MDSIGPALKDLERAEYIVRNRLRDVKARSWMWSMASMKRASPPDTSQLRVDNPNVIGPFGGISLQAEYAQIANNG